MGCTSSAPNTLSPNASKEDKSIQFEDAEETYSKHVEAIGTEIEKRTEIKVLPPSDITEPAQLVSNNKSITSLEPEKDLNTNENIVESISIDTVEPKKESKDDEIDDKMSKLKLEVVGKFFEITQQEKSPDTYMDDPNMDRKTKSAGKENEEVDATIESDENDEDNKMNSEEAEEASPSQSQSSRATRWEALADIAAELPPSLAVDPITGQIYSHSK